MIICAIGTHCSFKGDDGVMYKHKWSFLYETFFVSLINFVHRMGLYYWLVFWELIYSFSDHKIILHSIYRSSSVTCDVILVLKISFTDALGSMLGNHLDKPRMYIGCMKSGQVFSEP